MRFFIKVIGLTLFLSLPSLAQDNTQFEITPLVGYRFGGDFTSGAENSRQKLEIEEDVNYGLIFAWPFDFERQGEVLFNHYQTSFIDNTGVTPLAEPLNTQLSVSYLHVGGNTPINQGKGKIPLWVSGGLGLTHISPNHDDLSNETRFSINLGLFTKYEVSDNISLRLGTRLYATFFDSESSVLCNDNNCAIYVDGDVWFQSEVNAGITVAF
ncbi:outer membrane beta-barrel protein [Thalassotalea sp. PLHSN55]|uniref:outer membrane beta-barrel protein n=1 Tax=Thalassotalea sp. PLHSN55 TaxID=3435888 RepID=UPI003F841907